MSVLSLQRTVLTRHEQFWLDAIRSASNNTDPAPSLARAQKFQLLFRHGAPADHEQAGAE